MGPALQVQSNSLRPVSVRARSRRVSTHCGWICHLTKEYIKILGDWLRRVCWNRRQTQTKPGNVQSCSVRTRNKAADIWGCTLSWVGPVVQGWRAWIRLWCAPVLWAADLTPRTWVAAAESQSDGAAAALVRCRRTWSKKRSIKDGRRGRGSSKVSRVFAKFGLSCVFFFFFQPERHGGRRSYVSYVFNKANQVVLFPLRETRRPVKHSTWSCWSSSISLLMPFTVFPLSAF